MREIVATENLSLDGVMEGPEGWAFAYHGADVLALNRAGMAASDALLLGRKTYEEFAAYWPHQADDGTGIAAYLNAVPKYVVSSTLTRADWANTTIIGGDVAAAIGALKEQPGKNIGVIGSATLVQMLMRHGLIDEFSLFVHPLVLGRGKLLFREPGSQIGLQLVESRTLDNGVAFLRYRR